MSPEARRGEGLRCMREAESLFSAGWQRTGCNKIIYFRHSHMGPHLYWDQSEVQLPRRNRFPQQAAGQISLNPLLMGFIQDPQILRLERIKQQLNEVHRSLCQLTCGPMRTAAQDWGRPLNYRFKLNVNENDKRKWKFTKKDTLGGDANWYVQSAC